MFENFVFHDVLIRDLSYLGAVRELTGHPICQIFLDADEEPCRQNFDGVLTALVKIGSQQVGLILNDFRINGGSFGIRNSKRITAFFEYLTHRGLSAIYIGNSSGVRIMEGRSVFDFAFGVLPALKRFCAENLFVTCSIGKTIGLGAVLFGYGHLRLAVRESGQINLTGPEVFKLFFGSDEGFRTAACSERHFEKSLFVQEHVDSKEEGYRRMADLFHFINDRPTPQIPQSRTDEWMGERPDVQLLSSSSQELESLLHQMGEASFEVFPDLSPVVRTFLVRKDGKLFGVFANPPGHPQNMITSAAISRYIAALQFFRRVGIPIVSLLDSPGGDPRVTESDKNFIGLYVSVINEIVDYPHPKLGIVNGRCFGGATVLAFPKVFGSQAAVAVENSQIGIMHASIIDRLLAGVPRLAGQWQNIKEQQKADLSDLIKQGSVDRVIRKDQIGNEVLRFLRGRFALSELQFIDRSEEHRPQDLHPPQTKAL